MPRLRLYTSSFASGEISPKLLGRSDLNAYSNGWLKLRNAFIHPTGSVSRRPGLRHVSPVDGASRLVPFEISTEQTYLLVLGDHAIEVYANGIKISEFGAPWSVSEIPQINWTQSADTLHIVHPDTPPQKVTRRGENGWEISAWSFFVEEGGRIEQPHHRFANEDVELVRSGSSGTISLSANDHVFHPRHNGTRFRYENREVLIVEVAAAGGSEKEGWFDKATVLVKESLSSTPTATRNWTEQTFSMVRGWPVSVTFHQNRLVIGGSRDLPNRLWLSKSGKWFNFSLGDGLDDDAIEFSIVSDQLNAVRSVFSGRHLQVFTSGAEWMVTGSPLTPTNIQLHRQTRIGSLTSRNIPPRDIDGATIFISRNGRQIREFLFTDLEQAYQSTDLSVLSQHMVYEPVDMDYDEGSRRLYVVMSDGTLATLTVYRSEQIVAWTLQETQGLFLSVAVVGNDVYCLIQRNERVSIEVFDPSLNVDAGIVLESELPRAEWGGLEHLNNKPVMVVADRAACSSADVENATLALDRPSRKVKVGLGYSHIVVPLPPDFANSGNSSIGTKVRPIALNFRLDDTYALRLDVGNGFTDLLLKRFGNGILDQGPTPFTGDKRVLALGWRDDPSKPLWQIDQDVPLPFHLLSVSTEISVN